MRSMEKGQLLPPSQFLDRAVDSLGERGRLSAITQFSSVADLVIGVLSAVPVIVALVYLA